MRNRRYLLIGVLPILLASLGVNAQSVYYQTPMVVPVIPSFGPPILVPGMMTMATPVIAGPAPAVMPIRPASPFCCIARARASSSAGHRVAVKRLQTALTQLGFYQGSITAQRDQTTNHALAGFLKAVPPDIKSRFGNQVAAMAEAAVRHEFSLLGH